MIFEYKCPGCGNSHWTKYKNLNFCFNCRKKMGDYKPRERPLLRKTEEEKTQEERDNWII